MIAALDPIQIFDETAEEVRNAVAAARSAQLAWALRSPNERARLIGDLRPLLVEQATNLARLAGSIADRPLAEKLVSEVLPLIEAARFLQKNSARVLRSKRFGRSGRPVWLHGHAFAVHRKPFGVILIVGPANYPLFIPAVQLLHAVAAGNAVVIKPAPRCTAVMRAFLEIIYRGNLPRDLVQILPETPAAARHAARAGIDKAIFTGSSENGRDFLGELAKQNIPSVMELSGADPIFVRHDADLQLAAKAIAFGSNLNAGNTCMAPHKVIAHKSIVPELTTRLGACSRLPAESATHSSHGIPPPRFPQEGGDIVSVSGDAEALEIASQDEHGLGASIFSRDEMAARKFAEQLKTGFVTINDLIVPTADPRFPFGGVRASGFGVTRGEEGLLEMTYPQTVAINRSRFLPHLDAPEKGDPEFFAEFITLTHGRGWSSRFRALRRLLQLGWRRRRAKKHS